MSFIPGGRVVLAAANVSMRMGGEAARPYQYFARLVEFGIDAHLLAHERNRRELETLCPELAHRIDYVPNTPLHRLLHWIGRLLPARLKAFSTSFLINLITQHTQRRLLRRLIEPWGIELVHIVTPISPRAPCAIHALGVPVVIGPLHGNIDYPPAFRNRESPLTRLGVAIARSLATLFNYLIPGKRHAAAILVSNEHTGASLPVTPRGRIIRLTANAVDLDRWQAVEHTGSSPEEPVRFVFLGRLVDFKALDLLLVAMARARHTLADAPPIELVLIGDGEERQRFEAIAQELGLRDRVRFTGWVSHDEAIRIMNASDVFAFPSLRDPGATALVETMAIGLPILAARWGAAAEYARPEFAILVEPNSPRQIIDDLTRGMIDLAIDPERRRRMGEAARLHAAEHFGWDQRLDALIEIYRSIAPTLERTRAPVDAPV